MSLVAVIDQARQAAREAVEKHADGDDDEQERDGLKPLDTVKLNHLRQPDTPSTRTGPPRSLSFAYSHTPTPRHSVYPNPQDTELVPLQGAATYDQNGQEVLFTPRDSSYGPNVADFRTPLDVIPKTKKDKGKRKETRVGTGSTEKSWDSGDSTTWNPLTRWFYDHNVDSPRTDDGKADNSEYFPTIPEDPYTPTPRPPAISMLSRIFATDSPKPEHSPEQSDDQIVVRSPTINESANEQGEDSHGSPTILPKFPSLNRRGEDQRESSYTHQAPAKATATPSASAPNSPGARIHRAFSLPHQIFSSPSATSDGNDQDKDGDPKSSELGRAKWARLRSLLPHIVHENPQSPLNPRTGSSTAVGTSVNIIDELITGGLATLMPKLWFERDEKGHRRIPVLLHRLRLRITDSLHPLHKNRSVFRIECEYANGAARWVIYRELRDFITLHGHYNFKDTIHGAGAKLQVDGKRKENQPPHKHRQKLPDFPVTSLSYFKYLNRGSGSRITKAEFSRLQREQLENYLISLIRYVMFLPTSNRLASFLEISALSIALAQSGGAQYKAGFLRIEAVSNKAGNYLASFFTSTREEDKEGRGPTPFGRKSAGFRERREQRWCAVRESYLVALVEPGEQEVWDVFLLDSEFKIERPKRYYRQGLGGLLGHESSDDERDEAHPVARKTSSDALHPHFDEGALDNQNGHDIQIKVTDDDAKSVMSSIKARVSKAFHRNGNATSTRGSKKTSSVRGRKQSLIGLGINGRRSKSNEETHGNRNSRKSDASHPHGQMTSDTTEMTHTPRPSEDSDISTPLSRQSVSMIRSDGESEGERANDHPKSPPNRMAGFRSDSESSFEGTRTPMLDPSVQLNGMLNTDRPNEPKKVSKLGPASGIQNGHSSLKADHVLTLDEEEKELTEEERKQKEREAVEQAVQRERATKSDSKDVSKHTFYIINSQMRLKLYARNERQMLQFITALERVAQTSPYTTKNRFDSFAPIRLNVAAQWLVDGRDYFWNMSRAILMAKETIYIHDWWLSPELLLRRPNKEHYRLDKLLERKAKEGVKIYVIIYLEVSNRTTPTDSNYAKQRLMSLHPNIMVQRSPSHFQTGTFYWAHHEKLCVIDNTIAFMGGVDACFGRWDTPQHALTDDTLDTDQPEIWPGKDYSNPRVSDFVNLNKPEEDMYDRTKVPRMPWHDVGMQIVGQPARDLARHFVQRWNYLLRIKNHSVVMPFLLPAPEYRAGELAQLGLTGTCELQICRSAGPWSMGTPGKIECSVQNAYLKSIQMSEHFVYIENQFFITSTVVDDVKIENKVGDAIVQRIIRAHRDKTPWKCCIVIPLLPGFTFPVDHSDASAIRIILECQNRTISRGPDSIFSRLRREGIDPDEYISIFSLRNWAKMRGEVLVTEQVYIHAKVCIVDDRLAIIGSANINERSQRGERDSELAAVIRDTDLIDCTMAGKPFKVGRFAHTLRVRLMREHLGIDVDSLEEDNLMERDPVAPEHEQEVWDPSGEETIGKEEGFTEVAAQGNAAQVRNLAQFVGGGLKQGVRGVGAVLAAKTHLETRIPHRSEHNAVAPSDQLEAERTDYNAQGKREQGFASSAVPTQEEKIIMEGRPRQENVARGYDTESTMRENDQSSSTSTTAEARVTDGTVYGAPANSPQDDSPPRPSNDLDNDQQRAAPEVRSTLRKHLSMKSSTHWGVPTSRPAVHPDDFEDPICGDFWKDKWTASATHNTEIYRKVFRAIPDDLVTTWKQYKDFVAYHERLSKPCPDADPNARPTAPGESEDGSTHGHTESHGGASTTELGKDSQDEHSGDGNHGPNLGDQRQTRKPAKGNEPFERWEREEMEKLLGELNGHLVLYPTRFLEGEDVANNFLFNADRLLPLPIYD